MGSAFGSATIHEAAEPKSCPCGSTAVGRVRSYAACCRPLVRGEAVAETAEALMRSRYTAYVVGDLAHLQRSWHPQTLPRDLSLDPQLRWTGLSITQTTLGGIDDAHGVVVFAARWESGAGATRQRGVLEEASAFERRVGRWFYVGPVVEGSSRSHH